ncbi:MAG TPA: hypothetical protein VLY23_17460 [Candidatus Acidoferrum sp.]|nr:hypothetical protein [Candidatus Acidoferrum sp.]
MPSLPATPFEARQRFPASLRWGAAVWLAVWFPAYWHAWGLANFLHLCDLAVILTCIGVWTDSALLISSQAVSSLLVDAAWTLDAGWKIVAGHQLIGGTEYVFDPRVALWIRLLSLFHVALPPLLLWMISRTGYDRRGCGFQSAIALVAFVAGRLANPAANINFSVRDPFWHRAWGPPAMHVGVSVLFMVIVVYLPTHLALKRFYPPPAASGPTPQHSGEMQ